MSNGQVVSCYLVETVVNGADLEKGLSVESCLFSIMRSGTIDDDDARTTALNIDSFLPQDATAGSDLQKGLEGMKPRL